MLLPAYDKYVRPHVASVDGQDQPSSPGGADKGKGKEKDFAMATPDDGQDGDDEDGGKGDKKKKNSYKHLIKGIPGASQELESSFTRLMPNATTFRETLDEEG